MRKFNKDKCQSSVRATIKTGDTIISLMGKHSYEWSIVKLTDGTIVATTYPNRILARKAWNELKKLYK